MVSFISRFEGLNGVDIESSGQFRRRFTIHKTTHLPTSMDETGLHFQAKVKEKPCIIVVAGTSIK